MVVDLDLVLHPYLFLLAGLQRVVPPKTSLAITSKQAAHPDSAPGSRLLDDGRCRRLGYVDVPVQGVGSDVRLEGEVLRVWTRCVSTHGRD